MQYFHESIEDATAWAVKELEKQGGIGGIIALDNQGNGKTAYFHQNENILLTSSFSPVAMPLNCTGMYRGVVRSDGIPKTAIFNDDVLS